MRIGCARVAVFVAGLALPPAAGAQTFISQGPAPGFGPAALTISNDQPPNGTAAGSVQSVVADPTNPSTFYIGASNGGIWVTHDGGTTWTPLTDHQASLSITSLTLDPTDPSHKTLLAGTGLMGNGSLWNTGGPNFVTFSGGLRTGLLYTTDGGTTWSTLGGSTLAGLSIVGVEARGSIMLAAGFEPLATGRFNDPVAAQNGGLYRSTDGGKTFVPVSGGLPAGPVSSLVADPTDPSKFYAAVTSTTKFKSTSVFESTDSGATWTPVFTSSTAIAGNAGNLIASANDQVFVRVAAGPQNSLATMVINVATGEISGIYLSLNSGQTWSRLKLPPDLGFNAQAAINAAVAIDPTNPRIVYVTGDTPGPPAFTASAFRIVLNPNGTSQVTSLTDAFTADGSTIHADSRSITFDANGRLILVNDGGIYARTSPQTDTGVWRGLNGNLSVWQTYAIAFDANSKRLVVAGQDTGAAVQSAPGSVVFNNTVSGDGMVAAVNDRTLAGRSAIYTAQESLFDFNRTILDASGNKVGPTVLIQFDAKTPGLADTFQPPFVLNRNDPTKFAFGTTHVFLSQDPLNGTPVSCNVDPSISNVCVTLHLTDLGKIGQAVGAATGQVFSLAYGTQDNAGALLAGVDNPAGARLFLSTAATPTSATFDSLPAYTGQAPRSVVFDPRSMTRFYAADLTSLWGSHDGGASFQDLTPNLPATLIRPSALEFISTNGVNALFTGGLSNVANAPSQIAVADSDLAGKLSNWRLFGNGLPNAPISALSYNAAADALAVGTFGRGAWLLYDVTSYFPQATVLQFGLAGNDSNPDTALLTDGTVGTRPLLKYGPGTLTIAGAASYTGGTTILGGALQLGTGGAGGSILGNVVFCSDAGNPQCDPSTGKALVFNRSDTYQFDGTISGPGQVQQNGSGRTILTAASSYTGPTFVDAGTLSVNGSIAASPVFVEAGGTLGGTGTVGPTSILPGGTLAPGNSVGAITINGNLAFASGAVYLVELQGGAADRTNATASAALAGTVALAYLGGPLTNRYTILSAAGGRSGTFDGIAGAGGLPGFLTASLAYTPTDAQLTLTSGLRQTAGLAPNQAAVAAAIDAAFNTGGGSLPDLFAVPGSSVPGALATLSGEGVSGTQETAFAAAGGFLAAMLDQGAFWRSGDAIDVDGATSRSPLGFAADSSEHPAFTAMRLKTPAAFTPRWRAWMTAFDGTWSLAGDPASGSAGLSHRSALAAGGVDYQYAPDLLLGTAAGGSSSSFAVPDRATSGTLDGAHLGAYGVKTWGPWYLAGALGFAAFENSTTRTIAGVGATQTATGRFRSDLVSGRIELGLARAMGCVTVTPFAALQAAELWQGAFTETNGVPAAAGGPLGLSYGATSTASVPTFLGAQLDARVPLWRGLVLAPYARAAWVHEFSPTRAIDASFIALPGASFTVDGPQAARDAARLDAGAKLAVTAAAYVFAAFDGEWSTGSQAYAGKGGVRVAW